MRHSGFCASGILEPSTRCHFEHDHCMPDAEFSIELSIRLRRCLAALRFASDRWIHLPNPNLLRHHTFQGDAGCQVRNDVALTGPQDRALEHAATGTSAEIHLAFFLPGAMVLQW